MTKEELFQQIQKKESFLCIGLDTDLQKIPKHLLDSEDPIFEFNKQIIDATHDLCVAYKPNIAFYESMGLKGWDSLQKTLNYIPKEIFTIADAKRGDIGNTSNMYAKTFFETYNFDSVTVAPYMGSDSVKPFLDFEGKWAIVLALTSNQGGLDFQMIKDSDGNMLYQKVLEKVQTYGQNIMFVVGATRSESLKKVRDIAPDNFLLVPGVGAQGGSLEDVAKYGMNDHCGLLVNSSRGIIYASSSEDFAIAARRKAFDLQGAMSEMLKKASLVQ
jgi:orotidine-5'-phosphate decarboxylase|tara:strand:+ start:1366 stop:2184 length:819 start_codon:yes stop_codon:yes gene_type:complete